MLNQQKDDRNNVAISGQTFQGLVASNLGSGIPIQRVRNINILLKDDAEIPWNYMGGGES